jgi:hypothetical protein
MRIELTSVLATDFVMRPQSWFVSDLDTGASLVRRLFLLDQAKARLAFFLRQHGVTALPRLNAPSRVPLSLSPRQKSRIEKLYLGDFELVAALRQERARRAEDSARILAIAAE